MPAVAVLVEDMEEAHHGDPIRDDVGPVPRDEAVPIEDARGRPGLEVYTARGGRLSAYTSRSVWWSAQFTVNAFSTGSDSRNPRTNSGSSTWIGFVPGGIEAPAKRLRGGSPASLHDERLLRAVHAERVQDEVVEERH